MVSGGGVSDPHHLDADPDPDSACNFDADPDPDLDLTFHFDADPDPDPDSDPSFFKKRLKTLTKVLKQAHIPYILSYHLQIDAEQDPAYHFGRDPDANLTFQFDADPDLQHCLVVPGLLGLPLHNAVGVIDNRQEHV
jgi:hypothetical protein